jgi:hypothetical protein
MFGYSEDHLVEQPALQLMQHELGWDVVNCYGEPPSLNEATEVRVERRCQQIRVGMGSLLRQGYDGQGGRRCWFRGCSPRTNG